MLKMSANVLYRKSVNGVPLHWSSNALYPYAAENFDVVFLEERNEIAEVSNRVTTKIARACADIRSNVSALDLNADVPQVRHGVGEERGEEPTLQIQEFMRQRFQVPFVKSDSTDDENGLNRGRGAWENACASRLIHVADADHVFCAPRNNYSHTRWL